MKKFIGIIVTLALMLSVLSGCGFPVDIGVLNVNNERYYSQTVAEVNYDIDGVTYTRSVSMGELIEYYSNYGYYYVNYYGYTQEETLQLLTKQLASQQLLVLAAQELDITIDTMTDAEVKKAIDAVNEQMQSSYESLVQDVVEERGLDKTDEEETEETDDRTKRPVPAEEEEEFDRDEVIAAEDMPKPFFETIEARIEEGTDCDNEFATMTVKKIALKRLKSSLEKNFRSYEYYLNKQYESIIIDRLLDSIYSSIDIKDKDSDAARAAVEARYQTLLYGNQETYSGNIDQYSTDLNGNKTNIVYHPEQGFGYVKNLLVKFSDDAADKLSEFKSSGLYSDETIKRMRQQLVDEMLVDWYGEFVTPEDEDTIDWRDDKDPVQADLSIYDFVDKVYEYCNVSDTKERIDKFVNMIYGYAYVDNADSFAGNLFVSPSSKNSSTYVTEFQDLCNSLIEGTLIGETTSSQINPVYSSGEGSMGWCISDYGVHIVMVSYIPAAGANSENIVSLDKVVDYEKQTTLYDVIYDSLYAAAKSDKESNYQKNFLEANEDCITYYKEVWSSLLS